MNTYNTNPTEYPKCPHCNAWMNGETHLTKPCKVTKGELLDALSALLDMVTDNRLHGPEVMKAAEVLDMAHQ